MTYSADATREFQRLNRSFAAVSGYYAFSGPDNLKLGGGAQLAPVTGLNVAGNFFETLGVEPSLGRLFTAEECLHNSRPVVLLSHAFWKRQYRGDPGIVGQAIDVNKTPVTVIGVLPASFDFGSVFSPGFKVDMYGPVVYDDIRDEGNTMALIGRLKPGVSVAQAQAEADLLFPALHVNVKHPEYGGGYTGQLLRLKDYVSGKLRRSLIVLWCAVGMILLIVCVNLSNLLLARGAARSKEFAMRTALGAARGRLVRQLLTESLLLSLAGALFGLGLAFAITAYLAHQGTIALPLLSSVRIDGAALAWTLLVGVAAAVFFGLVPSLRISKSNLQEALKDSGHGSSGGKMHEGLRSALIVSEIALACVLLVGAGLLLRSFLRILDVDLGFEPSRAASIALDYDDKGDAARRSAIWQEVLRRTQSIPGVEAVGITDNLPMSRNRSWGIQVKGKNYRPGELKDTFVYIVSPGYLKAIGMHLSQGRDISWEDLDKQEGVVIINETVARSLWPRPGPCWAPWGGGRIGCPRDRCEWRTFMRAAWRVIRGGKDVFIRCRTAIWTGWGVAGRAQQGGPGIACVDCHEYAAGHQPRATGCGVPAHPAAGGPRGFTSSIFRFVGGRVCCAWADSCFVGNLWRDLLLGNPADAGDWNPHGVGSEPGKGSSGRDRQDADAGVHWNRNRDGGILGDRQFDGVSLIWDGGQGWGYVPGHDFVVAAGVGGGWIYTRSKGITDSPDDCFAQQLSHRSLFRPQHIRSLHYPSLDTGVKAMSTRW